MTAKAITPFVFLALAFAVSSLDCADEIEATQVWVAPETRCPVSIKDRKWNLTDTPGEPEGASGPETLKAERPQFGSYPVAFRVKPVFLVVIDDRGKVERIGIVRGEHDEDLAILIASVTHWEFEPSVFEGKPICSMSLFGMPTVYE